MRIHPWDTFLCTPPRIDHPATITIGVFDGVHIGHRSLIRIMQSKAATESWVVSFRENPAKLLKPEKFPGDITTYNQKMELLQAEGIDHLLLIDFSPDFSKLTGREFVSMLIKRIPVRHFVLGDNFRCGRAGDTSSRDLRSMVLPRGIGVDIPPPVHMDGAVISSTRIRAAIREGDLLSVGRMTERAHILDVANLPQRRDGGAISIHKDGTDQVLPPPGHYLVNIKEAGSDQLRSAGLLVGEAEITWPCKDEKTALTIEFCMNQEE